MWLQQEGRNGLPVPCRSTEGSKKQIMEEVEEEEARSRSTGDGTGVARPTRPHNLSVKSPASSDSTRLARRPFYTSVCRQAKPRQRLFPSTTPATQSSKQKGIMLVLYLAIPVTMDCALQCLAHLVAVQLSQR